MTRLRSMRPAPADRLIVALDALTLPDAVRMARRLQGVVRTVKIGSALFTACGPDAIRRMRALGFGVMLDLKFFDIPSTVELSCRSAVRHRITLLTVHATGGRTMLEAAVGGVRAEASRLGFARPRVLAVTVLTSAGEPKARAVRERVLRLSEDAFRARCDGVVASAQDAASLKRRFGDHWHVVCPGIRPSWSSAGDQRRVCTPGDALAAGADALVIGRPITAATNPRAAVQRILHELTEGSCRC